MAFGPSARAVERSSIGPTTRRPGTSASAATTAPCPRGGAWSSCSTKDPLGFSDSKKYRDRARDAAKKLGEKDAFIAGMGTIDGRLVSIGTFNFAFMGGSMGSVVGEKVARVFERAIEHRCPAIVFSSSGGARMQEGIFSLMQMAKTSAAVARFREIRQPYVSVMLHPTTGGVAASFAWL